MLPTQASTTPKYLGEISARTQAMAVSEVAPRCELPYLHRCCLKIGAAVQLNSQAPLGPPNQEQGAYLIGVVTARR